MRKFARLADWPKKAIQLQHDWVMPASDPADSSDDRAAAATRQGTRATRRPILIVPGLGGSGPTHWQSDWHRRYGSMDRVHQDDWDAPNLDIWLARLANDIARRPGVVLVAHSLACSLVAHFVDRFPTALVSGALLVSPADVESPVHTPGEVRGFAPLPLRPMPFPTIVVASDDDPFVRPDRARKFAHAWGARLITVGPCGHINPASGFGPWPLGLAFLAELRREIEQRGKPSRKTGEGQP